MASPKGGRSAYSPAGARSADCKTGREWGDWARDNGARTVESWKDGDDSKIYVSAPNNKAVVFTSGKLKPHASHHIGAILKWMLLAILGLLLAIAGSSGPLALVIAKLAGGG